MNKELLKLTENKRNEVLTYLKILHGIMDNIKTISDARKALKSRPDLLAIEINGEPINSLCDDYMENHKIEWIRVDRFFTLSYIYFYYDGGISFDVEKESIDWECIANDCYITAEELNAYGTAEVKNNKIIKPQKIEQATADELISDMADTLTLMTEIVKRVVKGKNIPDSEKLLNEIKKSQNIVAIYHNISNDLNEIVADYKVSFYDKVG